MNTAKPTLPSAACLWWAAIVAAIWGPVVYLLGAQWSLFTEYAYGWAVPCLCLFLAWQRLPSLPSSATPKGRMPAIFLLASGGLVFWAMRILQEANPLWRAASWGLALAAAGMTLLAIYLTQGYSRAFHFIFPTAFFLIAVPWPTPLESGVIQTLTRINSGLVTGVLNLVGVPALQHGNVIEVSAGMVGIDEACSGIRSLQTTLMMGLFFGEFYRLRARGRWLALAAGPVLAMAFNLVRTFILVLVAARSGLPAMERWHDPTGVVLLVICFLSLWGIAVRLARIGTRRAIKEEQPTSTSEARVADNRKPARISRFEFQNFSNYTLTACLLVWAAVVEISTEAWFRSHESRDHKALSWTARWPVENPTLQTNIIPKKALEILRCDEHSSAHWTDYDGNHWQAFFLHWQPAGSFYGRAKEALSKYHNPTDCLPASGLKLRAQLDPVRLAVNPGFSLAFHRYVFTAGGGDWYVFFSQSEDVTDNGTFTFRMTHLARLRAALAGSRNYGQNNFEAVLTGPETSGDALRVFQARLPELISTQPANTGKAVP